MRRPNLDSGAKTLHALQHALKQIDAKYVLIVSVFLLNLEQFIHQVCNYIAEGNPDFAKIQWTVHNFVGLDLRKNVLFFPGKNPGIQSAQADNRNISCLAGPACRKRHFISSQDGKAYCYQSGLETREERHRAETIPKGPTRSCVNWPDV